MQSNNNNEILNNITNLIDDKIQNLSNNSDNLNKVANYCQKTNDLEETKYKVNQSLAYTVQEINTLSNRFLELLDKQSLILDDMTLSISNLNYDLNIHREKEARNEISKLCKNKTNLMHHNDLKFKINNNNNKAHNIFFSNNDEHISWKPIDYSSMDNIGHGVKATQDSLLDNKIIEKIEIKPIVTTKIKLSILPPSIPDQLS
jgi:hypothetical protein